MTTQKRKTIQNKRLRTRSILVLFILTINLTNISLITKSHQIKLTLHIYAMMVTFYQIGKRKKKFPDEVQPQSLVRKLIF